MPVQIGQKSHSFSDPTGLLSDCHRRIEMFLGALQAVAAVSDRPLSDEGRRSLELALRYFREAAPRHTADEEESLFPRLRRMNSTALQSALEKLDSLENDHRRAEPLHELADEIGRRYLDAGTLSAEDQARFRGALAQLAEMYKRHIAIEDEQVFPVAANTLSASDKGEVAREMAERRQVSPVAIGS